MKITITEPAQEPKQLTVADLKPGQVGMTPGGYHIFGTTLGPFGLDDGNPWDKSHPLARVFNVPSTKITLEVE